MSHFLVLAGLIGSCGYVLGQKTTGTTLTKQPTSKAIAMRQLTVTDADSTISGLGQGLFDFGELDPLVYNDSTLAHTFTLYNGSDKAVTITNIQCANSRIRFDFPYVEQNLPVTVLPDRTVSIQLYYNLIPFVPGKMDVSAKVFTANQQEPSATLRMRAIIDDVAIFNPPVLDFGQIPAGKEISKQVRVTYSLQMRLPPGLSSPGDLPFLASDQSFITTKRIMVGSSKKADIIEDPHSKERVILPPVNNVVTYLVTIKPSASSGMFEGIVWIMPKSGTFGSEILKTRSIRVHGEVVSDINKRVKAIP